jgi:hypothetical protein
MKRINPKLKYLAFYTWDAMSAIDDWFQEEVTRACREEKINLAEFKRIANAEEEFDFLSKYDKLGHDYFVMAGISAFVHKDGTPANLTIEEPDFFSKNIKSLAFVSYDETAIKNFAIGGASVVWYDIGAQIAEKGIMILNGSNPGDIPWDYPRKYNLILNLKYAGERGFTIPQEIINASYRVYTNYTGGYIGQSK